MQNELQFFMTIQDQEEFLVFVKGLVDSINTQDDGTTIFGIDNCFLIFTPSPSEKNILYTGKLNIKTDECDGEERTKKVYRKIRNWMKKHYWSRLAYLNKKKKNKLTPSRAYWVGADAKNWKEENPEQHVFKLSTTSWMVFEIGV